MRLKNKPGRPATGSQLVPKTIRLEPAAWERAAYLGGGKISRGLRLALEEKSRGLESSLARIKEALTEDAE
jgi:hypothetical protein